MSSKPRFILNVVVSPIFVVFGIIFLILECTVFQKGAFFAPALALVFGVLLFVFGFFFYGWFLRLLTKWTMKGKETDSIDTYTFHDKGFEMTATSKDGGTASTRVDYRSLNKVCEYPEMWLLHLNRATVMFVRKDGMKEGTAEEVTELLKSKLGEKYFVCKDYVKLDLFV